MTSDSKKMIFAIIIIAVSVVLLLVFTLLGLDLKIFKINSVSVLLTQYKSVSRSEKELLSQKSIYEAGLNNLKNAQNNYNVEKNKYEAISSETIKIINEATTKENYSIEYMWIRLGNYAKANNLEIVLVEPGGVQQEQANPQGTTNGSTTTTNTNTSNTTTQNVNTIVATPDQSAFRVQVSGSYMNVSDFIFEVENDKELRFRLDNISMDYVSGTTIKTTFSVKNLIINK